MAIRVLLAEDHKLVRESLRVSLEKADGIDVVGEATTGREALELVKELSPNLVIMDVAMPDLNGIDATRRIVADHPPVQVIALSAHTGERFVTAMFDAGAAGYVLKDNTLKELVDAVRIVMKGKKYISPDVAEFVIDSSIGRRLAGNLTVFSVLSERERQVLQLLAEGQRSKQIARTMNISAATADTYRRNIMRKLDLHNVADLTRYAIREGLTEL